MRRVVISGLGVASPVGVGKDAFWQNWLNGVSGAITLDRVTCCNLFGQHEFGAPVMCEASAFDPGTHHVPPTYYSAAAAHQAFHDARLDKGAWDATRAGRALATAICGTQMLTLEFTRATNRGQEAFHSDQRNQIKGWTCSGRCECPGSRCVRDSIQSQRIYPTVNLESSDPRCDLNSDGMHNTIVTEVLLVMAKTKQGSSV